MGAKSRLENQDGFIVTQKPESLVPKWPSSQETYQSLVHLCSMNKECLLTGCRQTEGDALCHARFGHSSTQLVDGDRTIQTTVSTWGCEFSKVSPLMI